MFSTSGRALQALLLAGGFTSFHAMAETTVTKEASLETVPPQVEKRTYEKDGKTITETTTVTKVRETEAVSKSFSGLAAIIVSNRAGADYDGKIAVIEDLLSARISDLGFKVMTREVIADAARRFDPDVASSPHPEKSLEAQLTNQSSALRLAQNMGVGYIIQVSLASYSKTERHIKAYGNDLTNYDHTLRLTYKILDASNGGSLTGDDTKVTRTEQGTASATALVGGILDDLLDEATGKIATSVGAKVAQGKVTGPAAKAALVSVNLKVEAADLTVPDIRISGDNTVTLYDSSKLRTSPLSVSVEVDGVAVGSAPGSIQLRPGFSKIRLTREGFKPWERTINAVEGQTLSVALEMTEKSLERWKDSTRFLNELKNGAKLTDAQVKSLEGLAKTLEQSGMKIDYKVDTKDNLKVEMPFKFFENK